MKEKMESLQELLEDRNRQMKELWNVIQMLEDANMKLKSQADKWEKKEKQLRKEITDLKVSNATDVQETNFFVSDNTTDWKKKFHQELAKCRKRSAYEEKVKGRDSRWRQRGVVKFLKQVQDKLYNYALYDGIKPTINHQGNDPRV